jgi:hypothetical protein
MQQKLSAAERMLLPGAHSTGPGEDSENLPVWVELFRKYFKKKKRVLCPRLQGKSSFKLLSGQCKTLFSLLPTVWIIAMRATKRPQK